MRLPDSVEYTVRRRGNASEDEWRSRFREARQDLEEARAALDRSMKELEEVGGSTPQWKVAPPGIPQAQASPTDVAADPGTPLNYRLSVEIRRHREEIKRAEQALTDLEIEANLAGVPDDWRH